MAESEIMSRGEIEKEFRDANVQTPVSPELSVTYIPFITPVIETLARRIKESIHHSAR